jgi:WD40 repeat protein
MSVPHVYVSALPFLPMGSHLWKSASKASPRLMKVYKGRSSSWPAPLGTWLGHKKPIWSVAYSPDGRYVVSGSGDNTLRIWDAESGAAVGEPLRGHAKT